MTNMNQKPEDAQKLNAEIKKAWPKLSDDDIKLCSTNHDQFFSRLKEKQGVSREDGEKKLQELEKACGCSTSSCGSEKPGAVKAA